MSYDPNSSYGGPPPAYGGGQPAARGTNTLAIVALVLAFVCNIAGLVTGIIANNQIKQSGEQGAGLAKAAIIISCISIALGIIYVIVVIGIVGSASN